MALQLPHPDGMPAYAPFAYSRPDGTVIADGFSSGEQAMLAARLYQRAHGGDLRVWGRSIPHQEVGSPEFHWRPSC